jgi:hypothetical protein
MDLVAYVQIEDFGKIAQENGIEIPRLRGYRLMKDEKPLTKEEIEEIKNDATIEALRELLHSIPFWNYYSHISYYNNRTSKLEERYFVMSIDEKGYKHYSDIRWDRIHGKKRKILKYAIKKAHQRVEAQYGTWNKYAGKENVLYIHSRMGGNNWEYYDGKKELMSQHWFLDRVDDWWDGTYCDFYAKIKEM